MSNLNKLFRTSLQISKKFPSSSSSRPCVAISLTTNNIILNRSNDNNPFNTTSIRQISSNRSKRGLYDGKDIRSGNNVSFSMKKTKRKFKPNVFKKRLYSEILDEMIPFHVTTSALRTIDKFGGLDNYLLRSRHVKDGQGEGGLAKKRLLTHIDYCQRYGLEVLPDVTLKNVSGSDSDGDINDGMTSFSSS